MAETITQADAAFPDWTKAGTKKEVKENKIPWKTRRLSLSINSAATGLLAMFALLWIQQIAGGIVGTFTGIDSVLYSDRLIWGLNYGRWNVKSLVFPSLTNPVVCLIIGILAHRILWHKREWFPVGKTAFRIFLAWLSFYGIGLFFALIIQGLMMDRQFAYIVRPWRVSKNILLMVAPIFLVALLIQGKRFSRVFASTFVSTAMSEPKRRTTALIYVLIIPFAIQFLVFLGVHFPITIQSAYIFGCMALLALSTFLYGKSSSLTPEFESIKNYKTELIYMLLCIVCISWAIYWHEHPMSIYRLIKIHLSIGN